MTNAEALYERLVRERGPQPVMGGVPITGLLGEGGMGMVFKGYHPRLSIPVAVKVMAAPTSGKQTPLLNEARTCARVNHPNVARVYDMGSDGEYFYMIQEFVEGHTADVHVEEAHQGKMLSEGNVLRIGCDIARGLVAIHAEGFLHRDVKPANIILSPRNGMAKLVDLGLARPNAHASPDPNACSEGGAYVGGTAGYVAPEILAGLGGGPASDVYGLGVTLYELLVGRLAYDGSTTAELVAQQTTKELADIRTLRPGLSPGTAGIVQRSVRINPDERFADANTMLNELAKALQTLEAPRLTPSAAPDDRSASVVCLEDDIEVGQFLHESLEEAGFRVRHYAHPRAGLAGIREEPPDVVITDLHMPDLSGHDVCVAIRATPELADLPVVFLSSDAVRESIALAMQKGATDYLLKPVNPIDLVARVRCLARMAAARREYKALDAQYGEYRASLKKRVTGEVHS